jgi:Arc/MetJ-type ribon-helix-helix transcriptional regulator
MKLSLSLPDDDVAFIDEYAARAGAPSRSSVIHEAIGLLRDLGLERAYAQAWEEWTSSGEAMQWDATVSDRVATEVVRR